MALEARKGPQLSRVCLRVRDVRRSAAFYSELFGFVGLPEQFGSRCPATLVMRAPGAHGAVELVLTEGIPPGEYVAGLEHLSFEIDSAECVSGFHEQATQRGYAATQPRLYDGHWQTFVFDPDGYKIEVFTRDSSPVKLTHGNDG